MSLHNLKQSPGPRAVHRLGSKLCWQSAHSQGHCDYDPGTLSQIRHCLTILPTQATHADISSNRVVHEPRRTLSTKVLTPCAEPALLRDRAVDPDSFVSDERGRCATASPPDDAALAALSATLVLCNLSCGPGLSAQWSLLCTDPRAGGASLRVAHSARSGGQSRHVMQDVYQLSQIVTNQSLPVTACSRDSEHIMHSHARFCCQFACVMTLAHICPGYAHLSQLLPQQRCAVNAVTLTGTAHSKRAQTQRSCRFSPLCRAVCAVALHLVQDHLLVALAVRLYLVQRVP